MENFTAPPFTSRLFHFFCSVRLAHNTHFPGQIPAKCNQRLAKGIPESQFADLPDDILWQPRLSPPLPQYCAKEIKNFMCSEPEIAINIVIWGAAGLIMQITRNFLVICRQVAFLPVIYATWKVLKCGAGEGWRRSVGPNMWEMKKCYLESMSRGITYMK